MSDIIDLSFTIEPHFRWKPDKKLVHDLNNGDNFQTTAISCVAHSFTHVDAPRHVSLSGSTTDAFDLNSLVGEATVVDVSGIAPDTAITAKMLGEAGRHVRSGDLVLIKTSWDRVQSIHAPEFWTTAPYMTRDACEWLLDKDLRAIGYDFPQDYPIRGLLTGEKAGIDQFVTHDVLLRNGVLMIEYLCNLHAVQGERVTIAALPIKLADSDGAPARVIAWR